MSIFGRSSNHIVEGSGRPAAETRDVDAFSSVELAGSNNVVIRAGDEQSVVVKADDNLLEHVTTTVESGCLVIDNIGNVTAKSPMSVEIGMPRIDALTLSGSGYILADALEVDSLRTSLPGSGTLAGSGTAERLDVAVSGSGSVQFTRLVAADVHADVSGSGTISVTATERLAAAVSGSGAILYSGNPPDVATSVSGSGVITGA